jgi:hypothetical protein
MVRFVVFLAALATAYNAAFGEKLPQTEVPYKFTFNGMPFKPHVTSLHGDPGHPQPGDLISVAGLLLTLGPERSCHFVTPAAPAKDGRLLIQLEGGKTRPVAAIVHTVHEDKKVVICNPLAKLSADEIKGLWGIHIGAWPNGIAALQAIENFTGREGMGVLVEAWLDPPLSDVAQEAVLTVERIRGQRWCKNKGRERPDWHCEDVRRWWRQHGAAFVAKRCADRPKSPGDGKP